MEMRKDVCNFFSHAMEFGWERFPLANGNEKRRLQHLESCTGVRLCKTPPLLMGMRKDICSSWSHALEFGCVRLPLANGNEKRRLQHLESCAGDWLGKTPPLANGCDKRRLHHLESCTGDWLCKTPPLLMGMRKGVCNIWSHAMEFGCARLPHN